MAYECPSASPRLEHGSRRGDDVRVDRDGPDRCRQARRPSVRLRRLVQKCLEARSRQSLSGRRSSRTPSSRGLGPAACLERQLPGAPARHRPASTRERDGRRAARLRWPVHAAPTPSSRRAVDGGLNNGGPMSARGSVASEPIPLVNGRASTDIPTTTSTPDVPVPVKVSPVRLGLAGGFLVGAISLAIFTWVRFLGPQVTTPVVASTASAPVIGPVASNRRSSTSRSGCPRSRRAAPLQRGRHRRCAEVQGGHRSGRPGGEVGAVFAEQTKIADKAKDQGPVQGRRVRPSAPRHRSQGASVPIVAPLAKERAGRVGRRSRARGQQSRLRRRHQSHRQVADGGEGSHARGDGRRQPEARRRRRRSPRPPLRRGRPGRGHPRAPHRRATAAPISSGPARARRRTRPGQYWPAIDKGPGVLGRVAGRSRPGERGTISTRVTSRTTSTCFHRRDAPHRLLRAREGARAARPPRERGGRREHADHRVQARERQREVPRHHAHARVPLRRGEGPSTSTSQTRGDRVAGNVSQVSARQDPAVDQASIACGNERLLRRLARRGGRRVDREDRSVANQVVWRKKLSDKGGHPSLGVNNGEVAVAWYERPSISSRPSATPGPCSRRRPSSRSTTRPFRVPRSRAARPRTVVHGVAGLGHAEGRRRIYASRLTCR